MKYSAAFCVHHVQRIICHERIGISVSVYASISTDEKFPVHILIFVVVSRYNIFIIYYVDTHFPAGTVLLFGSYRCCNVRIFHRESNARLCLRRAHFSRFAADSGFTESVHDFSSGTVKQLNRNESIVLLELHIAQNENSISQPSKLLCHLFRRGRRLDCLTQNLLALVEITASKPLGLYYQLGSRICVHSHIERESPEFSIKGISQFLIVLIIFGFVYYVPQAQLLLDGYEALILGAVDKSAVKTVQLYHRKVHILALVIDSDDVVLIENFVQSDFVSAPADACNPADWISVVVWPLHIDHISPVLSKNVSFGICSVKSFFQVCSVLTVSVQSRSVYADYIGNIGRFLHSAFYFQRIQGLESVQLVEGIKILHGKYIALTQ